jgi:drug/metabolite transporter (DMT)-like permease
MYNSPVPGLILIASVIGFIADWLYKRKGGKRPTRFDYAALGVILVVCFGGIALLIQLGYSGAVLAHTVIPLVIVIFGMWELSRLRTRLKNPIQKVDAAPQTDGPRDS